MLVTNNQPVDLDGIVTPQSYCISEDVYDAMHNKPGSIPACWNGPLNSEPAANFAFASPLTGVPL